MQISKIKRDANRYMGFLGLFIVSSFIIHWLYISYGPLDLSPDEAQYWDWSRRLDISYYSKGPVIAYLIAFLRIFGGNTEIGVRIGAVIISMVLMLVLYDFYRDILKSEGLAFTAVFLAGITPLFSAGSVLMTTDPPFLLFWAASVYLIYKAIFYNKNSAWIWAGISMGLGILSKYTMALLYPSLLLYLVFSRDDRYLLKRSGPYKALFLSLLFTIPILLWNYGHDWVGMRHVMGQAHIDDGFRIGFKDFFEFIGSQAGVLSPFIFLGILFGMVSAVRYCLKGKREFLFLFMTSAPILLFFLLKSLQGKVEANWAAQVYITAFPLMVGVFADRYCKSGIWEKGRKFKWIFLLTIFTALLMTLVAHYPGMIRYMGINLPPKKDPTTRLTGWDELGKEAGRIYNIAGDRTFIISDRYQITSELAFYIPGNPQVYNINLGRRMNQYDIWGGIERHIGWDALYVRWDKGASSAAGFFNKGCDEPYSVKIVRNGIVVREFFIYRCYGFKGGMPVKEEGY